MITSDADSRNMGSALQNGSAYSLTLYTRYEHTLRSYLDNSARGKKLGGCSGSDGTASPQCLTTVHSS